jgi:hypothetical protein
MGFIAVSTNLMLDLIEFLLFDTKKKRRIVFQFFGKNVEIALGSEDNIDEKIAKIDLARANLQEALNAIDELKSTAELHKKEVFEFEKKVEEAKREAVAADQIKQINRDELISLFQLETRRSRLIGSVIGTVVGFLLGILASVAASFIYAAITHSS